MKLKKALILFLTLTLLLVAVCIFAANATSNSNADARDLKISAKTLELEDSVHIVYAVPVADAEGAQSVKMLVWLEPQNEYTYGTQAYELSPDSDTAIVEGEECYTFTFRELAAKHMTVDVYARVYATDENGAHYSDVEKYSILQYAYNMLGKTSPNVPSVEDESLLKSMLEYGAAAQIRFGENTDRLANDSYYKIKLENTLLADGTTYGLYLVGDTITVTATETNSEGESFRYWRNSTGAQVSDELTYTITVQAKNETYTAVYGEITTEPVPSQGLRFTSNGDGTCYVSGIGTCTDTDVIIPSKSPGGDSVTAIGNNAFNNQTNITSVIIPNSVTSIGDNVFYECTGLTSVTLSDSVTSIGNRAFNLCRSLTSITIPNSVTSIGDHAFRSCSNLTSITIPDNVITIGDQAFAHCSSLENIVVGNGNPVYHSKDNCLIETKTKTLIAGCKNSEIPIDGSVTFIGNSAFRGCNNLANITIPNSVTGIGEYAFSLCTNLANVVIGDNVISIGKMAFSDCTNITTITIPNSVTSIGNMTFARCSNLANITIPNSVTSIGSSTFIDCSSLSVVYYGGTEEDWANITINDNNTPLINATRYYYSENQPIFEGNYWHYVDGIPTLWEQFSFTLLEDDTYEVSGIGSVTANDIVIPSTYNGKAVSSIGVRAFLGSNNLTSLVIPGSVKNISNLAFSSCTNLKELVLVEGIVTIGNSAFFNCIKITDLVIPNSVKSLGHEAFGNCSSLQSITIGTGVETFGERVFKSCSNLEKVYFNATSATNPTSHSVFFNTDKNQIGFELIIGANVNKIPNYLIDAYLNSVVFLDNTNCTEIGEFLFNSATLSSVYITNLEAWCKTSFGYSNTIHKSLYLNDELVTHLMLPNTITSVSDYAFAGCISITRVTVPNNIESIGENSFYNCSKLLEVYDFSDLGIVTGKKSNGYIAYYALDVYTEETPSKQWTTEDSFLFYEDGNTCYLMGYVGDEKDITLPELCNGKEYIMIDWAFSGLTHINSVSFPDNIRSISAWAFRNCHALTEVTISESIAILGEGAFYNCTNIQNVNISSLEKWCKIEFGTYKSNPLYYAEALYLNGKRVINLVIPCSVTEISKFTFVGMESFNSITFEHGVSTIDFWAFNSSYNVKSVMIPLSMTNIDDEAFSGCSTLEIVYYTGTAEDWANISIGSNNTYLTDATRYYYSESQPTVEGNYWHYVDGVPTVW